MSPEMSESAPSLEKTLLENALRWFEPDFRQKLVSPIENQFPNYSLPRTIQAVLRGTERLLQNIQGWPGEPISARSVADKLSAAEPDLDRLFKQIIFTYRRWRAAYSEGLTEKTFHLELAGT